MQNSTKWLGPGEQTQAYFAHLRGEGLAELKGIRDQIRLSKGDGDHRAQRTWGALQAAAMVNRTPQWLRDNDPDVPRNGAGHGRWTLERIIGLMERAGELYQRPPGTRALILAMSKFKGGVGNSTNTLHLAHGLAMRGLRVLIWDWDGQGTSTTAAGGVVPDAELEDEDLPIYPMVHDPAAILDEDSPIVRGTYFHGVDLVPANSALNELELSLITQYLSDSDDRPEIPPQWRMTAVLSYIADAYDVVLIDCPPALSMNTMNALLAADGIITSVKPEMFDRASLVAYMDALSGLYANYEKDLKYFRILISQYQDGISSDRSGAPQSSGHRAGEIALRKLYGDAVLDSMMHHSKEIANASSELSTVLANDKPVGSRGAYNRAVGVVNAVVDEVFGDLKRIWEMEREDD